MRAQLDRTRTQLVAIVAAGMLASCSATPTEVAQYRLLRTPPGGFAVVSGEAVCHVHNIRTVELAVPERAGMCVEPSWRDRSYIKARLRRFPNSFWEVYSCFCEGPDSIRVVRVCSRCRDAERAWREAHGMTVPEESPTASGDGAGFREAPGASTVRAALRW